MKGLAFACRVADLAYSPLSPESLKHAAYDLLGLDLVQVLHCDATDAHALLLEDPMGALWISCRGTQNLQDALLDADARFVGFGQISAMVRPVASALVGSENFSPGERIHEGFLRWYESLRMDLISALVAKQARKVRIVGHSLGGAGATPMAYDLSALGIECIVVTFGSPRVGNAAFVAGYDRAVPQTTRVVHHLDLVPTMPSLGFEHVHGELRLRSNGTRVHPALAWLGRLVGYDRQFVADLDGEALRDHRLGGYLEAVSRYELLA